MISHNRCPELGCGEPLSTETFSKFKYVQGPKDVWVCPKGHSHEAGNKGSLEYRKPFIDGTYLK